MSLGRGVVDGVIEQVVQHLIDASGVEGKGGQNHGRGQVQANTFGLRFGLPAALPKTVKAQIKKADKVSAWMEATQIAGFSEAEATKIFGRHSTELTHNLNIRLRPPAQVRNAFLARHASLSGDI